MVSYIHEAHGAEMIEDLQDHDSDEVYQKAVDILVEYFEVKEEGLVLNASFSS